MEVIIDDVDIGYKDCLIDKNGIYFLWNKLVDYATYWELNSPTVNGNPDYERLSSFIQGFLVAKKWDMEEQYLEKCNELKSQPAEIVEKIRKSIHYYPIALLDSDKELRIKTLGISKEVLDDILKQCQK